jgi:AraC family transcriptional regulator
VPPEWLERVRESLHDRYAESVRLADLAREAGVHPSHLSRSFSRFFGTGLGDYLRALRIAAARRELETTDRPIARIALRTGFSDQSHLTRWLKRATGMTPGQYRAAHRHA